MPLDTAPTSRPTKSGGVRIRQRLMIEALQDGNRKAARYLARAAADYRRNERRDPDRCEIESDWVDRCGW
jgi:hypothetical protein